MVMPKQGELLAKIRKNYRNVSIKDFEALIKSYGYIEEGKKHPKAIIGPYTMPYKKEKTIKSCYIKDLLEIIDSLGR
jgi:hypothetical protein